MAFEKLKTAGPAILALCVLTADAEAKELKLKSHGTNRTAAQLSASQVQKGQVPLLADLAVAPMNGLSSGMPNTGVCGNWNSGYVNVRFRVRNQGGAATDPTVLNLTLRKNGQSVGGAVLEVPSLVSGQQTTVFYPVPPPAQPKLSETLEVTGRVDPSHYIEELSEANNAHTGYCHGPAT